MQDIDIEILGMRVERTNTPETEWQLTFSGARNPGEAGVFNIHSLEPGAPLGLIELASHRSIFIGENGFDAEVVQMHENRYRELQPYLANAATARAASGLDNTTHRYVNAGNIFRSNVFGSINPRPGIVFPTVPQPRPPYDTPNFVSGHTLIRASSSGYLEAPWQNPSDVTVELTIPEFTLCITTAFQMREGQSLESDTRHYRRKARLQAFKALQGWIRSEFERHKRDFPNVGSEETPDPLAQAPEDDFGEDREVNPWAQAVEEEMDEGMEGMEGTENYN